LDNLREAVVAFTADSHTVTLEEESGRDQIRHRVSLKQPHVSVYLMCGDYLQCLRTALDQAVWSLINHRTSKDSESSEFPVFGRPLDSAELKRSFRRKVDGLSSPAINYIESIQPYNQPAELPLSASPLWCLHELNRIDKHRRISVRAQISLTSIEDFGLIFPFPDADSAEVSEEPTDYGFDIVCRGKKKNLKPKISTVVNFGEPKLGIFMDIDEVSQLYDKVAEVLVALASRV